MFFTSKNNKALKEGKKLLKQKKWRQALEIFESLRDAQDIDRVELLTLTNEARQSVLQQEINTAHEAMRRGLFFDALVLLEKLLDQYPG